MKLTHDPKHNIAYLRLHERTAEVQTIHFSAELNVDMTPNGTVYGIELLNANEQIETEQDGALVVVDRMAHRAAGKRALAVREKSGDYPAGSKKRK